MPSSSRASITVVVVDDDPDTATTTAELLNVCGFRAHPALSGRDGLRLAVELAADALILDLMMPDVDGFEVARQIVASGTRPMLVAVSGQCAEVDRRASAAAGFDFHFAKPVDPALLVGCLHRLSSLLAESRD